MTETMGQAGTGAFYALMAALSFALWNIYLQRALDRGIGQAAALVVLALSVTGVFVPMLAVAAWWGTLPPVQPAGVGWFAVAGLMTSAVGPFHAAQATRRIGAVRTTSLRLLDPLFAYGIAALFLGEALRGSALAGIALIVLALGLLQLESRQSPPLAEAAPADQAGMRVGMAFAVAASLSFTLGSVARKAGLATAPSALVAGLTEGIAGLLALAVGMSIAGGRSGLRLVHLVQSRDIWWSGLAGAAGTLFLNLALQRVAVPVAVALRNTSPWFALVLVPLLLGRRHRPGRWTWVSTALLTAGMLLIVLR